MFRVLLVVGGVIAAFLAAGWRRTRIADRAVDAADVRMRGRRATSGDLEVEVVFSYGAVDLSATNLVVWILVKGADSERIPAWLILTPAGRVPADKRVDDELAQWLAELHREVRDEFSRGGWGSRPTPSIGVESSERVSKSGGQFFYFK